MSTADNKALIQGYFETMSSGGDVSVLFADNISWWVPPGSGLSGTHKGKDAVLEFLGGGVGYYDESTPMVVTIDHMIAEDDWVSCEFRLEAKTASGKDYKNYYHFAFQVENGLIKTVKEYLDTHYAFEAFQSPLDQDDY
jgi:ketosteroid isomerase-like protein